MEESKAKSDTGYEDIYSAATERYNAILGNYSAELNRTATVAQETAKELWQSYVQEVQSAGGGDDYLERVKSAQKKAQEDYAGLNRDFQTSTQKIQRDFTDSIRSLYSDYGRSYLSGIIQSLEEVRATMPAAPDRAASQTVEKGKG